LPRFLYKRISLNAGRHRVGLSRALFRHARIISCFHFCPPCFYQHEGLDQKSGRNFAENKATLFHLKCRVLLDDAPRRRTVFVRVVELARAYGALKEICAQS
jgi:hypothetical protein